jgi:hypothetical protein
MIEGGCFSSRLALLGLGLAFVGALRADNAIVITVNPAAGQAPISPYIYGVNSDLPGLATPGSRRYGGNRLTGYNWETNASNAGTDYLNESDNFLVSGLPAGQQSVPAIALTNFHDASLAEGVPYTVLTLQMAGYVSADESGPVAANQAPPSSRWNAVADNTPGGTFPSVPNLADGIVHMDELLNLLITKYGSASGSTGVKGYDLDNEPDLWSSTHPYLHPAQPTCAEIVSKSVALAQTVKRMDPSAEVLGPVSYGTEGYLTFQNAPDWAAIQAANPAYRWFLDYYLDRMSQASAAAGFPLLDVFDLHRYSDDTGGTPNESITSQTDYSANLGCDEERVQAPRVLWDPTFAENSWVQQYYSQFLPWIPNLRASINRYYPAAKLGFTEYSYGGESDISGGIAEADVLGIYGKYGVYLGCHWLLHSSPPPVYISSAFNLYLNYDGLGGKFGPTSVSETDSDTVNSSAYASVDSASNVHLVVLNKSFTTAADFTFQISGPMAYGGAQVYAFDASGSAITLRAPAPVSNNQFSYQLPPLTAAHFVLSAALAVTGQPQSEAIATGSTVVLTAAAHGATSYQWLFNGSPVADSATGTVANAIAGATGPQLMIANATVLSAGSYTCLVSNATGSVTSAAAILSVSNVPNPGLASSISTRAFVGTGDNILIGGFYIVGSTSRTVLIQGLGPALGPLGVSGALAHPELTIHQSQNGRDVTLYSNAGWGSSQVLLNAAASVYATPVLSPGSADSELLLTLPPGGYSAEVSDTAGGTGVALCAIYELP